MFRAAATPLEPVIDAAFMIDTQAGQSGYGFALAEVLKTDGALCPLVLGKDVLIVADTRLSQTDHKMHLDVIVGHGLTAHWAPDVSAVKTGGNTQMLPDNVNTAAADSAWPLWARSAGYNRAVFLAVCIFVTILNRWIRKEVKRSASVPAALLLMMMVMMMVVVVMQARATRPSIRLHLRVHTVPRISAPQHNVRRLARWRDWSTTGPDSHAN